MDVFSFLFRFAHLIYANPEKGFLIMKGTIVDGDTSAKALDANNGHHEITVLATSTIRPSASVIYDVEGSFQESKYGRQVRATHFSLHESMNVSGLVRYLSSGLFKGIGERTATKIVDALGLDALKEIRKDPAVLDKVKGLSRSQREVLASEIGEDARREDVFCALMEVGLSFTVATALYGAYGAKAYDRVKENPYRLIEELPRFGFLRADQVAQKLNIPRTDIRRLKALVTYIIRLMMMETGDSYVLQDALSERLDRELAHLGEALSHETMETILEQLTCDQKIVIENGGHIYLRFVWIAERICARILGELMRAPHEEKLPARFIDSLEGATGISYTLEQKKAIESALKEPVSIITGGPGTGKTTIVSGIIKGLTLIGYKSSEIMLLAPTGRAAERLKELSHVKALTIHKALGYDGRVYKYDASDPIPDVRAVIVDECSMVDVVLFARLLQALRNDCRLVLVGDRDQLPSVSVGDVLNDLIASGEITTSVLTENHRQAEGSSIIPLASYVREGIVPKDLLKPKDDFSFIPVLPEKIAEAIEKVCKQATSKGNDIMHDIQVLVPMYKGDAGIDAINARLQRAFNPFAKNLASDKSAILAGDKVLQLVNRMEKGVMNGDIGVVLKTKEGALGKTTSATVLFGTNQVTYEGDEMADLKLAYAVSIHKAQGSEFPIVILPISFRYFIMLRRKLIYTAITRASQKLVILGEKGAFIQGVSRIEEKRKSALVERVIGAIEEGNFSKEDIEESNALDDDMLSPYDFMD